MGKVTFVWKCIHGLLQGVRRKPSKVVKVIFWKGETKILKGRNHLAGKIMFENPDMMVCQADSFFIGKPISSLSIDDRLRPGTTYFVLPLDQFSHRVLSVNSLASLCSSSSSGRGPVHFKESPFEYVTDPNGRVSIRVVPEFISKMMIKGNDVENEEGMCPGSPFLCNTPELKKQFVQLVRTKDQTWSPKLETITEYKIRYSPCRFIGMEWKEQEIKP